MREIDCFDSTHKARAEEEGLDLMHACTWCLMYALARAEKAEAALLQSEIERGHALVKASQYEEDWRAAKVDFGAATGRMRSRLREAERERDEARAQAVWVEQPYTGGGWPMQHLEVLAPRGKILKASGSWGWRGDGEADARFGVDAEAEALAAGRALPWWEVEA